MAATDQKKPDAFPPVNEFLPPAGPNFGLSNYFGSYAYSAITNGFSPFSGFMRLSGFFSTGMNVGETLYGMGTRNKSWTGDGVAGLIGNGGGALLVGGAAAGVTVLTGGLDIPVALAFAGGGALITSYVSHSERNHNENFRHFTDDTIGVPLIHARDVAGKATGEFCDWAGGGIASAARGLYDHTLGHIFHSSAPEAPLATPKAKPISHGKTPKESYVS